MDFSDTPEEAAFREEAKEWLVRNMPTSEELEGLDHIGRAKFWEKRKFDHGWSCISWPREYGGQAGSAIQEVIWGQEESKFVVPETNINIIGQGMCGPTMMAWATEEQNRRFLPCLASGEEVWCQLFSEPAGGSDLAALRTRANREGDEWVINGQKIWTSGAHYSDYAILVVRTDPLVPKHRGLSFFFISMKLPGIEIKPIKQISGDSNFNEVYFTDVRVSDSQRLGAVGQGWQVALTTLMNERATIGGGGGIGFDELFRLAQKANFGEAAAIHDAGVRGKLADWYVQETGLRYTGYRALSALSRGDLPGPENSIGKLVGAPKTQDMASFAIDLLDGSGVIANPEVSELAAEFQQSYMGAPGLRIAGGTDEVMANIIAERVLGLPQDVRVDKGIPFNEVPNSE